MKAITIIIFLFSSLLVNAQQASRVNHKIDTVFLRNELVCDLKTISERRKQIKSLIIPTALITYGLISLDNENLQTLDRSIKEEIREDNPRFHTNVDNYLQ